VTGLRRECGESPRVCRARRGAGLVLMTGGLVSPTDRGDALLEGRHAPARAGEVRLVAGHGLGSGRERREPSLSHHPRKWVRPARLGRDREKRPGSCLWEVTAAKGRWPYGPFSGLRNDPKRIGAEPRWAGEETCRRAGQISSVSGDHQHLRPDRPGRPGGAPGPGAAAESPTGRARAGVETGWQSAQRLISKGNRMEPAGRIRTGDLLMCLGLLLDDGDVVGDRVLKAQRADHVQGDDMRADRKRGQEHVVAVGDLRTISARRHAGDVVRRHRDAE